MPYLIDEVNGHFDLLHAIVSFAAGWPQRGSITSSLTGNPQLKYVRAYVDTAPLETWTIVCTTGGGDGVAIFSVTGSTSGAQADATAGVQYQNAYVSFKITGPALYNCVVGDQFQFTFAQGDMAAASIEWTIDRYTDKYASGAEAILHGDGSGSDEIYVGYKAAARSVDDAYGIVLQGFTGYQAAELWAEQPGAIPMYPYNGITRTDAWPPSIAFAKEPVEGRLYLSANSRRLCGCVFFEGYSAPFYTGFILPYFTPGQWPYPLMIGGSIAGGNAGSHPRRYSDTSVNNSSWFYPLISDNQEIYQPNEQSSLRILAPDLNWYGGKNYHSTSFQDETYINNAGYIPISTWPYGARCFEHVKVNIDGSYPLFPIILFAQTTYVIDSFPGTIHGVPDGCFAITGDNNNQENTFTIGSDVYVVCRNSAYASVWDYMAMRLDA